MIKVSLPFVLDAMRRDNLICWHLYDGTRELDRQDDKDITIEESIDALRDAVSTMSGDILTIKATKPGSSAKLRTFFLNLNTAYAAPKSRSVSSPMPGDADLYRELANLQAQLAEQRVRHDMQKEIDLMKQQIGGIDRTTQWMDLAKTYHPYIGGVLSQIISGIAGTMQQPTAHLNGHPDEAAEGTQITMPTDAALALKRLYEIDPDFTTVIVKFAQLAEDRAKYTMLKGML